MLSILRVLAYVNPEMVAESELEWLCTTDCPFEDENHWTAFRQDGSQIFNDALRKLNQLSILIPIPIAGMDKKIEPKFFRVHRLIQRFAQRQDEPQLLGFSRALYRCVDHRGNLMYAGCLEYLNSIMEKSGNVNEELKQMCAAFALKAYNNGDKLASFIKYLEKAGGNSPETEILIRVLAKCIMIMMVRKAIQVQHQHK